MLFGTLKNSISSVPRALAFSQIPAGEEQRDSTLCSQNPIQSLDFCCVYRGTRDLADIRYCDITENKFIPVHRTELPTNTWNRYGHKNGIYLFFK